MRKMVLATDEELAERTGRTRDEWFSLLDESGFADKKHGEVVEWLLDAHHLQLYWAHCIGHKYVRREE